MKYIKKRDEIINELNKRTYLSAADKAKSYGDHGLADRLTKHSKHISKKDEYSGMLKLVRNIKSKKDNYVSIDGKIKYLDFDNIIIRSKVDNIDSDEYFYKSIIQTAIDIPVYDTKTWEAGNNDYIRTFLFFTTGNGNDTNNAKIEDVVANNYEMDHGKTPLETHKDLVFTKHKLSGVYEFFTVSNSSFKSDKLTILPHIPKIGSMDSLSFKKQDINKIISKIKDTGSKKLDTTLYTDAIVNKFLNNNSTKRMFNVTNNIVFKMDRKYKKGRKTSMVEIGNGVKIELFDKMSYDEIISGFMDYIQDPKILNNTEFNSMIENSKDHMDDIDDLLMNDVNIENDLFDAMHSTNILFESFEYFTNVLLGYNISNDNTNYESVDLFSDIQDYILKSSGETYLKFAKDLIYKIGNLKKR